MKKSVAVEKSYTEFVPVRKSTEQLHENCVGCRFILPDQRCKYMVSPKLRKRWPCWFRLYAEPETAPKEALVPPSIFPEAKIPLLRDKHGRFIKRSSSE